MAQALEHAQKEGEELKSYFQFTLGIILGRTISVADSSYVVMAFDMLLWVRNNYCTLLLGPMVSEEITGLETVLSKIEITSNRIASKRSVRIQTRGNSIHSSVEPHESFRFIA
jgi:hypothetical protein